MIEVMFIVLNDPRAKPNVLAEQQCSLDQASGHGSLNY